ncbi:hypothetical protein Y032_0161g3378 [Ancylostoma ceylanicum]|uniref:Uncharacterized protein n=1 Tax=Ancylostoma ceylanicum TaxID=53326 RepID=A0A016SXX9_9BILA|nr:hypothetical protein Y032_0161g3378 [Ancylostoma ceylanicum]
MVYLCLAPYESEQMGVAGGLNVPIRVACVRPSFPYDDTHPVAAAELLRDLSDPPIWTCFLRISRPGPAAILQSRNPSFREGINMY